MSKNEKNTMFGKKRSKLSVLPVVFSAILGAGALAGTGVSVWQVSKNYQESAEFKKSYNARINVNPVAFEKVKTDKATAEANLKESASRLSAWLKMNGAESYDVSYELTNPDSSTESYEASGWLSANFTVNKVSKIHVTKEDEEKIDNDPYLSYFSNGGFNTNNRCLVYRWYDEAKVEPTYSILNFNDIFDMPTNLKAKDNNTKVLIDKDGKPGVLYKIKDNSTINKIYSNLKKAYEDTKPDPKPSNAKELDPYQKPTLFVINNIEQMFNEINYHLLNYGASLNPDSSFDLQYYKNIYDNTDYQKLAKTVSQYYWKHDDRPGGAQYKLGLGKLHTEDGSRVDIINGEALHFLDYSKHGTIESPILNKYVEHIYKYEDNDYLKIFPDKITDTYHNDEASKASSPNLSYAWIPQSSTNEADSYLSKQVNNCLKCKIVSTRITADKAVDGLKDQFKPAFASREVPPKFVDTIFGSNIIGALSLGFLIFLLALLIILAVLYRTTGVMSWISLMFMLSMTGLIATVGATTITMSLLFGLFVMSMVGFIAALSMCGRIRRRLCSNEDTSVAVIKGLKKSLWPLVDISVITLLFGICFTYIAPLNLNQLGVSLIVGGFATFISMYLINGLLMLLFFNNGLTMNKFVFLGRPNNKANEALAQSNSYVPASMDATKLEFAFYDKLSTTKFGLINWKTFIIVIALAIIMIIGIIVFSIMGLANNTLFHSSMCVFINSSTSPIGLLPAEFKYSTYSNIGNYWYFYCDVPSDAVMAAIRSTFGSNVQFGHIIGNTNKDILTYAMVSMVVAAVCASVFTGIRSNWTTFVPMLAGSILVPLLILGIASIAQVKFDQNVVLGFALVVVVNTLMSNTILASVNEAWFRKESYNPEEIKFIVTTAAKNCLNYILWIALGYALIITFFGICQPHGLMSIVIIMIIGLICSVVATPIVVCYILYYFLIIRSKLLTKRAARLANKVVVNMDEIDEQSIEGINKFTKSRAYAKKPVGETK